MPKIKLKRPHVDAPPKPSKASKKPDKGKRPNRRVATPSPVRQFDQYTYVQNTQHNPPRMEPRLPAPPFSPVYAFNTQMSPFTRTPTYMMPSMMGNYFVFAAEDGVAHMCLTAPIEHLQLLYAHMMLQQNYEMFSVTRQPVTDPTVYGYSSSTQQGHLEDNDNVDPYFNHAGPTERTT